MSIREWHRIIIGGLIALVIVATGGYSIAAVRKAADKSTCLQIELLKEPIRASISDSIKQLPQLEYYKQHPVELQTALEDSNKTLTNFAPKKC